MKLNSIVTLADSKYFELLMELIESIKAHDKNKNVSICVLDAGLTEEQNKIHLVHQDRQKQHHY